MNKLIKAVLAFSLKNKFFIFFLTFLLVCGGYYSFRNTPIDAFPDVTNTTVTIITQWPGRSAEEVEKFITRPIEMALNPAEKKISIRSSSLFGLSVTKVSFEDGVDFPFARMQVVNLLGTATIPDGVKAVVQPPYGPTGEIFRYTLTSDKKSIRELKTIQQWVVEKEIRAVPGVADVSTFGGQTKTFQVTVDPQKSIEYGVTPLEIFNAVSKSNMNVGGDVIVQNGQSFVVRGIGQLNNINEIKKVIVAFIGGSPVYIWNVAEVTESSLPPLGQAGRDSDPDVVEGIVLMRKGQNPSEVIANLKNTVSRLNSEVLPDDVKIKPFYDREVLIHYATNTVLHNMLEGIVLVTLIVFLFMADWRTTVIVAVVIPLALLFAFVCLRLKGMPANLLSMGAIDFGIIIDGAVVMMEGIFVLLDYKAKVSGMDKFNKLSKLSLIKRACLVNGKGIFFSKMIIVAALLPIFSFEKVEGKMFSPLAWTLGFALLGALILTFTLVPVMAAVLLKKEVREKHTFFLSWITKVCMAVFDVCFAHPKTAFFISIAMLAAGVFSFTFVGSEFLPQLNEGSIYIRATGPLSTSLNESVELSNDIRKIILEFPQVKQVISQTGRPDGGSDPTGFYNQEFLVDLYPKEEWSGGLSKEDLITKMNERLSVFPGVDLSFSQPISDNVAEEVSGVKGSIVIKTFGPDLAVIEEKEKQMLKIMQGVKGVADLGILYNLGQPELNIKLDQQRMSLHGVSTADANMTIQLAIGGDAATQIFEGERRFDLRVRYPELFRNNVEAIGDLRIPTMSGSKIPLREIAAIEKNIGPSIIYRDKGMRYGAIKFSIRGRDMGSTIAEAQKKVKSNVQVEKGYSIQWAGDFENQQRATKRLQLAVPLSLLLIFFILFLLFGKMGDALLVLSNVPFAIIGGILALLVAHANFSISAGIGFIALFGICIQNGVILLTKFKHNLHAMKYTGEFESLGSALRSAVKERLRSVIMTALMAAIGLLPAALSSGIGSEASKPLAIVVIGGLITNSIFNLFVFPIIFYWTHKRFALKFATEIRTFS
ncbi:efflux RND transporter permease subunit [Chitinophaga sancti]|uniref:Cobalt-zinc-cadmium resistance protein CzcA n=1 Tax=Chitinophaga sancti TaxID=1004 RepID=A0A1K1T1K7_9BACT|nr:CusA/CzcA family heavy metal efflux RND transporter [Chitinophaga sancti]WQD63841.1 CusA/CzcA family heavy metal efflux RND transporter [Chitinophaga sancti]WQG90534.1 CusA/CzcA family heavy metal efflux RND transporter [Chitinophaga sancti]SFW90451.1 cobalt-zinc-cadmium resistance protein CzcA [Chitinophaga sancti]